MKYWLLMLVLASLLPQISTQLEKVQLPLVSQQTQNAVNFQLNLLRMILPTYNWLFCNKPMLYRVLILTSQALHSATQEMKLNKANYVQGDKNIVIGRGNLVIGCNNSLVGMNNWFFTSDYHSAGDRIDEGILALGNYKIVLSKASLILVDPTKAISLIDSEELERLKR